MNNRQLLNKTLRVKCDACDREFFMGHHSLRTKPATIEEMDKKGANYEISPDPDHQKKYHKITFRCPVCDEEYIVAFIDGPLKRLGMEIQRAIKDGNKRLVKKLQKQYKAKMDKINNKE